MTPVYPTMCSACSPVIRKLINKVDYNALDVKMEKSKVGELKPSIYRWSMFDC